MIRVFKMFIMWPSFNNWSTNPSGKNLKKYIGAKTDHKMMKPRHFVLINYNVKEGNLFKPNDGQLHLIFLWNPCYF